VGREVILIKRGEEFRKEFERRLEPRHETILDLADRIYLNKISTYEYKPDISSFVDHYLIREIISDRTMVEGKIERFKKFPDELTSINKRISNIFEYIIHYYGELYNWFGENFFALKHQILMILMVLILFLKLT
jgi:hypothetical protein